MHTPVFQLLTLWYVALIGVLAVRAHRSQLVAERALALELFSLLFTLLLGLVAVHRREAGYLDVALVLALLGFLQTVATARLVARRRRRDA